MLMKEKIVATTMILAGGAFLALSWRGVQGIDLSFGQILAAALLTTAIVLADRYPIHLLRGTKASMASIPIYLAVVLLPIHLAVTTAGAGMLLSSLQARAKRKLILSDILGQTGRWLVISFIGHRLPLCQSNLRSIGLSFCSPVPVRCYWQISSASRFHCRSSSMNPLLFL